MTVTEPVSVDEPTTERRLLAGLTGKPRLIALGVGLFVLLSLVRVTTDAGALTSSSTIGVALRATIPILLAGLAALWADRVGIVNIGIEGMMILGTWFGGYAAWQWGPWAGVGFAVFGGVLGGLLHGVAVIRFNVDHVISGVAINILALGAMRYLSELVFTGKQGGGITQSPPQSSAMQKFTVPFLSGGDIGSWHSPDILGNLEGRGWFLIGDAAGVLKGLTWNVSLLSILALLLVPATAWVMWRTSFGLRVRSSGEAPHAAESLGVKIAPLRYQAMAISGGLAGMGGGFLAIVSSSYYRQDQTGGRGYIGLATAIFGNWQPTGVLGGAGLFGFGEALNLVGPKDLPKMFLFFTVVAALAAVAAVLTKKKTAPVVLFVLSGLSLLAYLTVEKVPEPLTKSVPYVLTLIVLATASQRLRPPKFTGRPFRSGEDH